jgi:hypothetical protein
MLSPNAMKRVLDSRAGPVGLVGVSLHETLASATTTARTASLRTLSTYGSAFLFSIYFELIPV